MIMLDASIGVLSEFVIVANKIEQLVVWQIWVVVVEDEELCFYTLEG